MYFVICIFYLVTKSYNIIDRFSCSDSALCTVYHADCTAADILFMLLAKVVRYGFALF